MKKMRLLCGCVCLAAAATQMESAHAQGVPGNCNQPNANMPISFMAGAPAADGAPTTPQAPARPNQDQTAQPLSAFNESAPAGTEGPSGYSPQMLGDSLAITTHDFINIPRIITGSPGLPPLLSFSRTSVIVPAGGLGGSSFKVADDESPRPEDRAFLGLNWFTGVDHSLQAPSFPTDRLRFNEETFGYEKTFMDGGFSIEVRVPFFQFHDEQGAANQSDIGDITIIAKGVLLGDSRSNNLVSGGVALTLPTGPNTIAFAQVGAIGNFLPVASINPTIIQPFVGFLTSPSEDMYVHGFSSLAFSTDSSVPNIWFNDIAAGYYVYRGSSVSVIPTAELHLTTPLAGHGSQSLPIGVIDTLDTTLGAHITWNNGADLSIGWCFPLTGPQEFANEFIIQFNYPLGSRG